MRITKSAMLLSPLLLCFTMGFTDCQLFSTTTVPPTDTTPPVTWDAVWLNGNYVALAPTSSSFVYHLAPGTSVLMLSSAMDQGGVSKVTTGSFQEWTCCDGPTCRTVDADFAPVVTTQGGSVGATVSNGVWWGQAITVPTSLCSNGSTLASFMFAWATTAEDFHGNQAAGALQSIVYP
jgi:hypothetical protein